MRAADAFSSEVLHLVAPRAVALLQNLQGVFAGSAAYGDDEGRNDEGFHNHPGAGNCVAPMTSRAARPGAVHDVSGLARPDGLSAPWPQAKYVDALPCA